MNAYRVVWSGLRCIETIVAARSSQEAARCAFEEARATYPSMCLSEFEARRAPEYQGAARALPAHSSTTQHGWIDREEQHRFGCCVVDAIPLVA